MLLISQQFKGYDSEFSNLSTLLQSPEFVEALKMDRDFMQSLNDETQRQSVPKGFHHNVDDDTAIEVFKDNLSKMSKGNQFIPQLSISIVWTSFFLWNRLTY